MNLLNLLKYQVGNNLVESLSHFLGDSPEKLQTALEITFPSVLHIFTQKAASEEGAYQVLHTVKEGKHDGSILSYLTGLFSGGSSPTSLISSGGQLTHHFIGQQKTNFVDIITQNSEVKRSSASTLLQISFPLILGVIGKQIENYKLDTYQLMELLSSQKEYLKNVVPPELIYTEQIEKTIPKVHEVNTSENSFSLNNFETVPNYIPWVIFFIGSITILSFGFYYSNFNNSNTNSPIVENSIQEEKNINQQKENHPQIKKNEKPTKKHSNNYVSPISNNTPIELKEQIAHILKSQQKGEFLILKDFKFHSNSYKITKESLSLIKDLSIELKKHPDASIDIHANIISKSIACKKSLIDLGISQHRIKTLKGEHPNITIYFN